MAHPLFPFFLRCVDRAQTPAKFSREHGEAKPKKELIMVEKLKGGVRVRNEGPFCFVDRLTDWLIASVTISGSYRQLVVKVEEYRIQLGQDLISTRLV